VHKLINKFLEIEQTQPKTFLSEEHFKLTSMRDAETGGFIVCLPFNEQIKSLGES
jgi:hypothetical protein